MCSVGDAATRDSSMHNTTLRQPQRQRAMTRAYSTCRRSSAAPAIGANSIAASGARSSAPRLSGGSSASIVVSCMDTHWILLASEREWPRRAGLRPGHAEGVVLPRADDVVRRVGQQANAAQPAGVQIDRDVRPSQFTFTSASQACSLCPRLYVTDEPHFAVVGVVVVTNRFREPDPWR